MNKKIKVGCEKDRLYVIPVTNLFRNTTCWNSKSVQTLNKYHMPHYYCVNMFKFLLSESKANASLHTFCHPCYCHPCYQPKVTGVTMGNRDDTNMIFSNLDGIQDKELLLYSLKQKCNSTGKRSAMICECVSSLLRIVIPVTFGG